MTTAGGTIDGAVIAAGGVSSNTYVSSAGALTASATSTDTYYAHENGNVTNSVGAPVYKKEDGTLTLSATTAGTKTEDPLATLDDALKMVDSLRSDLGAVQNRFESAITNLSTNETNLTAARSRIQDADYAVEVANMTRAQILQQAGTSVLSQANQLPQGVLSLLR
ncbi:Flagellin [compost metagenome]